MSDTTTTEEIPVVSDKSVDEMDLDEYKALVRKVAIAEASARDWCDEEFNGILRQLGLAPVATRQPFVMQVPVTGIIEVSFDAYDKETAWMFARDHVKACASLRISRPSIAGEPVFVDREELSG